MEESRCWESPRQLALEMTERAVAGVKGAQVKYGREEVSLIEVDPLTGDGVHRIHVNGLTFDGDSFQCICEIELRVTVGWWPLTIDLQFATDKNVEQLIAQCRVVDGQIVVPVPGFKQEEELKNAT